MSNDLIATHGIAFISFTLAAILYGIALLQTWLYFQWYPKDSWWTKSFILALCFAETLQTAIFSWLLYWYLIENFGNVSNLQIMTRVILWGNSKYLPRVLTMEAIRLEAVYLFLTYLVAFMVQCYFAHSIWRLTKAANKHARPWAAVLIHILAFTSIGSGIAQTVRIAQIGRFNLLDTVKVGTTVQAGAALVCDVAITVALCITLHNSRIGIHATDSMLNRLIVYAVNRGTLTSVCACTNMVLFLALPDTFWFFLGLRTGSKVYMNSVLATLNTREYIKSNGSNLLPRPDFDEPSTLNLSSLQYITSSPLAERPKRSARPYWQSRLTSGPSIDELIGDIDNRHVKVTVETTTAVA